MNIRVFDDAKALGKKAADQTAELIAQAIEARGEARIVVSTGESQFTTFEALIALPIDWSKVVLFHLDEYVDLPVTHKASFQKYLQERFLDKVGELKEVHFGLGEGDLQQEIDKLTTAIHEAPIDVALIGIGANAHIAFNDPPADFDTRAAFHIVELDDRCKQQQVDEGWFPDIPAVPDRAISMTVHQILQSKVIISCVPYGVKAEAVKQVMDAEQPDPQVPASILKTHSDWHLYLDKESAAQIDAG